MGGALLSFILSFVVWVCPLVGFIVFMIKAFKNAHRSIKNEQQAFDNMMMNTNDDTVIQYMTVLKSSDKLLEKHNVFETRIRIAQGYIIVADSPNVSDQVKEQFKTLLVVKGIPVEA